MPLNFLMINQPLNNRGDEAAHKALVRSILCSIPDSKIQVLFVEKDQNSINQFDVHNSRVSYINVPALKGNMRRNFIRLLKVSFFFLKFHPTIRKILPLYRNADIVLSAPGGICMGGFQNWEHVIFLAIAKLANKPIAYYGRSIGPFPTVTFFNKVFKRKAVDLLNYFSFTALRDSQSEKIANILNVKYESTVDSVFLESPVAEIPKEVSDLIGDKPYVVFVPNMLVWHYAYRGKASVEDVLCFYKKVLNLIISKYKNHNIIMLPQTFNYKKPEDGDINFFRELKQYTQCQSLIIIPDTYSSDIQQMIISKAECMIGARYHSVVFALNQAVPFVALSYEHKISGLLESLKRLDSMVDITTLFDSEENMQNVLMQFEKTLNLARKDIDAQQKAKKIAQNCFDKFLKFSSEKNSH